MPRAHSRAHRPRHRRRLSGRDRHQHPRGADRGPARPDRRTARRLRVAAVEEAAGLARQQGMIPAIVLAAVMSTRMGRTKALLPAGPSGETFLSRVVRVLREGGADAIVVVIGGDAAAVRASLPRDEASLAVVENPHFEDGQLSSLHVGLAAVEQRYDAIEAAMVTLVDLPLISPSTVRTVFDTFRAHPQAPLVRPRRDDRYGHPVIFNRSIFGELRRGYTSQSGQPGGAAHPAAGGNPDRDEPRALAAID